MSQDEFTPRRPEYSDEPPPREREQPPQRAGLPTSGFPWVPVVIVCSVLGVLGCVGVGAFLLIIPAVSKVRDAAARAQSANNLRQIGLAIHHCNASNGEVPQVSGRWKDPGDKSERTLFVHLLPYIEQDNLYKSIIQGTASPNQLVKTYVSPNDFTGSGSGGECSYAANWQFFQMPPPGGQQRYASLQGSLLDGPANVILLAEIYQNCNGTLRRWGQTGNASVLTTPAFNRMEPVDPAILNRQLERFQVAPKQNDCSPPLAQTPHASGMLVCLGDGSVRSLVSSMSLTTWQRACAPADGAILGQDPNTNDW